MSEPLAVIAFVVLWWAFSVALFCGVLFVFDRDALYGFIEDVWRLIRL